MAISEVILLSAIATLCAGGTDVPMQDRCPDIVRSIHVTGAGNAEGVDKEDVKKEAFEIAKRRACEILNRSADYFLTYQATCPDGCEQTESWWEYCGEQTPGTLISGYCAGSSGVWHCSVDVAVYGDAHMVCEPKKPVNCPVPT